LEKVSLATFTYKKPVQMHNSGTEGGRKTNGVEMANGEQMTNTRAVTLIVALVLALNGGLWWAVSKQSRSIDELTTLIYAKMDDRYRRFEADATHRAILDRVRAGERRDDRLENEIEAHIIADDKIHQ